MKKDGSNNKEFLANARDFNINNGWVYYNNKKGLHKIKTDGTSNKTLVKEGAKLDNPVNVTDGICAYSVLGNRIYTKYILKIDEAGGRSFRASVNTDGTNLKLAGSLANKAIIMMIHFINILILLSILHN